MNQMNKYAVQLFVLNIINGKYRKEMFLVQVSQGASNQAFRQSLKKEKRTSEIYSPGNNTWLCSGLFHDLRLGVGASRVKIQSLTRQNDSGFSILTFAPSTPPPLIHFHRAQNSIPCTNALSNNVLTCHRQKISASWTISVDKKVNST